MNFSRLHYYIQIFKSAVRWSRIVNWGKLWISYILSMFGVLVHWRIKPLFISIEPINSCNLRCPECPVGMRYAQRVKGTHIDLEVVQTMLDELHSGLMHVILYFQGEPLMSKNFIELVRIAKSYNLLTSTSTNAQLLTEAIAESLVRSGLDRLIVSIDGATQETYETYRVGGQLNKALEGVERLVRWKRALKSPLPFIEIQFLVLRTNEHQMNEMKRIARQLKADKLTFKSAQLYDFEKGHPLLTTHTKYARYALQRDGTYQIKSPLYNRCKRLWTGAVITSGNDILPCCFDKDSRWAFGNLNNGTFLTHWHSNKAYQFRKTILTDRKQFDMCRNCSEK